MLKLRGCYTAIVTPFQNGRIDFGTFAALIEDQIAAGIDGIVPVGTTGESPTVDFDEHQQIMEFAVRTVNHRCAVVAGSGANSTEEAIRLTKFAAAVGADATLQVTPYYNKPTREGLYRHFRAVAEEGQLPVVLYNVPSRTSREIDVETIARLARHQGICAVKEAGGSVDRVSQILDCCDITVVSGDDSLTLPMMVLGATGVISVASNVAPAQVRAMVHAALDGHWQDARKRHFQLYKLFRDLFIETNPIPVKAALAMMGKITEEYRLPLCEMDQKNRRQLTDTLRDCGLIPPA